MKAAAPSRPVSAPRRAGTIRQAVANSMRAWVANASCSGSQKSGPDWVRPPLTAATSRSSRCAQEARARAGCDRLQAATAAAGARRPVRLHHQVADVAAVAAGAVVEAATEDQAAAYAGGDGHGEQVR